MPIHTFADLATRLIKSFGVLATLTTVALLSPSTSVALVRSADLLDMCLDIEPQSSHMITTTCNNQGNQRMWLDWLNSEQKARWKVPQSSDAAILRIGTSGHCMAGLYLASGPKCDKNFDRVAEADLQFVWNAPSVGGHRRMIKSFSQGHGVERCLVMDHLVVPQLGDVTRHPKGRVTELQLCIGLVEFQELRHFRQFWWVEQ